MLHGSEIRVAQLPRCVNNYTFFYDNCMKFYFSILQNDFCLFN